MSDTSLNSESVAKLKVPDLKKALKERGQKVTGTKAQLTERLQQCLAQSGDKSLDSTINDDISLEDTLDVSLEEDLIKDEKKPAVEDSAAEPPIKKICFNESKPAESEVKKVVISAVPESERLKKRAAKFGLMSEDARKKARAERFGLAATTDTTKTTNTTKLSSTPPQSAEELERLKKRAERFGTTVSPTLSKVEEQMKISKRQERFGILTSTSVNTIKSNEVGDQSELSDGKNAKCEDLKKKRAERFGITK